MAFAPGQILAPRALQLVPFTRRKMGVVAAQRRQEMTPPTPVVLVAVVAAVITTIWSAATHSMLLYGDARAHLNVARHVTDSLQPGLAQLGSVWLPLPHLLLVPLVAIRSLWHSGAAGAIVGGLCFVYAALRVFSLIEELTGKRFAAWVGFVIFTINLNLLYLQSTALTEPVLLAFVVGAAFHLVRWMRTLSARDLVWAAVLTVAATLTRYEGWALLAGGVAVVALWSKLRDRRQDSPQANLILYAVLGMYGVALWFLYNAIIFHDPLYFLHSAYSAHVINVGQAQYGLLATKGSVTQSLITYGWDMLDIVGIPTMIMSGIATLVLMFMSSPTRQRTMFTLALLFAPIAFEFVSLYAGQTTIRIPQLFPYEMWNVRYGVMALPFCAVAIGALVARIPWSLPFVAAATAATTSIMAVGTPLALADGRSGVSSASAGHPELAAAFLSKHYSGGEILADDSVASAFIFATNLDLNQFVTVGAQKFWTHALASPAKHVAWAVTYPGDAISADMAAHPDRFSQFTLVTSQGQIKVYERLSAALTSARGEVRRGPG